jgi:hypothetical protein
VPGAPGTPPSANLLLWLAADTSLYSDSFGVYEWDDQSGTANDHSAFPALYGGPTTGQVAFPNGLHPAVSFAGASGLVVDNTGDFNLQEFTVYLVGDLDNTKLSDDFLGNWTGWVLGGSDGTDGSLKWSTEGPSGLYQVIDPIHASTGPVKLGYYVPAFIEGSYSLTQSNQAVYLNGANVGNVSNPQTIDYSGAQGLAIGALFPASPTQPLVGDIQEILIYSSVSQAQDAAVKQYIINKYFTPSVMVPSLISATRDSTIQTIVTVALSEQVTLNSATNITNYSINNGVTVSNVSVLDATHVVLTTSPMTYGPDYLLTVNGLQDWVGNTIVANSQITITVPVPQSLHVDIANLSGQITLTWSNASATLQSSSVVQGPWSNVTGATSPYTVTNSIGNAFFRLQ